MGWCQRGYRGCLSPDIPAYSLIARRRQLPWPDLPCTNTAVARCKDLRVTKVHLRGHQGCLFGAQVGGKLEILRLQHSLLAPLCFGYQLTTALCGPGLGQVRLAAGVLAGKGLVVSNRLFKLLLCCRLSLIYAFLPFAPGAGGHQTSVPLVLSGLRGSALRLAR